MFGVSILNDDGSTVQVVHEGTPASVQVVHDSQETVVEVYSGLGVELPTFPGHAGYPAETYEATLKRMIDRHLERLEEDAAPRLGGNLDLNNHQILGTLEHGLTLDAGLL